MFLLRCTSAALPDLVLTPGASVVLGRSESCTYRVEDGTVSRRHASVEVRDGGVLVTDLGSANGTFLNDRELRLSSVPAKPGDKLQFGNVVYRLEQNAEAAPAAAVEPAVPPPVARARSSTVMASNLASRELSAAAEMQRLLVQPPREYLRGYELGQLYQPVRTRGGGSFVAHQVRGGGELWAVLGEVHGGGPGTGILMAYLTGAVRALLPLATAPVALLEQLGQLVRELPLAAELTATATLLRVDAVQHRCELATAGHHPALLRRASGTVLELRGDPGLPLGALPAGRIKSERFVLAAGETVLLTSAGVANCQGPGQQTFGAEQVMQLLRQEGQPQLLAAGFATALDRHRGPRDLQADASLLAVARHG